MLNRVSSALVSRTNLQCVSGDFSQTAYYTATGSREKEKVKKESGP